MANFFVSWLPKVGGLMIGVGGILVKGGDMTYGPMLITLGGLIVGGTTRQYNVTSEQSGIKTPEVVVQVEPIVKVVQPLTPPGSGRPK